MARGLTASDKSVGYQLINLFVLVHLRFPLWSIKLIADKPQKMKPKKLLRSSTAGDHAAPSVLSSSFG